MKKVDNFNAALVNLKDIFNYEEPLGNVELTGMVALFEICFEQAWKAMKEVLEDFGYSAASTGSPKVILKTAYQSGMIKNEELWLDALVSRNNVTHSYNKAIAKDIIERTKNDYYNLFVELSNTLKNEWLN